jgi:poly(3-hydroxyoctanoate) depolymerase
MRTTALCSLLFVLWAASGCGDLPGSPGSRPGAGGGSAPAADPSNSGSSSGSLGGGPLTGEGDAGAPGSESTDGTGGPADSSSEADARMANDSSAAVAACLPAVGSGSCPISVLGTALSGTGTQFQCEGESLTECLGPNAPSALGNCAAQFKPAGQSRCAVTTTTVSCSHVTSTVGGREVDWQVPLGTPPPNGWPAVVLFQASLYPPSGTWSGDAGGGFGIFNYLLLEAMLLDNGFAVIEPTADNSGNFWDTNFPSYDTSGDATFMPVFLNAIQAGTFGSVDRTRLFASGMSSGGFMTSRMAVSYPGWFVALAIQSGGYASCAGGIACSPTLPLPADHPPTLFLHGALDVPVPVSDSENYYQDLVQQGTQAEIIIDAQIIHEVLKIAPQAVTCWFLQHDKVHP